MAQDKLLERFLKKGTVTTSINSTITTPKHAAVDQSVFQPKKLVTYSRNTAIGSPLSQQVPPAFIPAQTPPGSTVTKTYLSTEGGDFLLTENNDNLEIQ